MHNYKKIEIDILNIQMMATILFIFSLFISLILNYNEKLSFYNKAFLSDDLVKSLSLFNRFLVVILGFVFLYCNYVNKDISKNNVFINLQIVANVLSLISSFIVLYVVYINQDNNNFINPNV